MKLTIKDELISWMKNYYYSCVSQWRLMKKIQPSWNTHFIFSAAAECTGLKATWRNMVTEKEFPVAQGTVVSLTCTAGYQLEGDRTVTCDTNTEFLYSTEPQCSESFTIVYTSWQLMVIKFNFQGYDQYHHNMGRDKNRTHNLLLISQVS